MLDSLTERDNFRDRFVSYIFKKLTALSELECAPLTLLLYLKVTLINNYCYFCKVSVYHYIYIVHTVVFIILLIGVHSQTQHIIVDKPLYRRHVSAHNIAILRSHTSVWTDYWSLQMAILWAETCSRYSGLSTIICCVWLCIPTCINNLCIRWIQVPTQINQVSTQNVRRLSRKQNTSTESASSLSSSRFLQQTTLNTKSYIISNYAAMWREMWLWRCKLTSLYMNCLACFYVRTFELWVCKLKINESNILGCSRYKIASWYAGWDKKNYY
jgi:hypothetical protein